MLAILPAGCLLLFVLLASSPERTWREAVLDGAVCFGVAATFVTEVLSLEHGFGLRGIAVAWVVIGLGLGYSLWRRRPIQRPPLPRPGLWDVPLLLVPAAVMVATLLSALLSAPNNWDSMTYHLGRVAHWLAAGSVEHFPTSILRQLHQSPFAEYLLAHLQALSGGDRLAGLVQWAAMLGCLAGVSSIAGRLGAGRQTQLLAAAITVTIPMAVLQASSTQNDLVVALCLVAFADAVLRLDDLTNRRAWLLLGGALGLALLTKATAYLYAFPFLVWLAVRVIRRRQWKVLGLAALAAATVLAINAGHAVRNGRTYGSPLGPGNEGEHHYVVEQVTIGNFFAGPVRNLALHFGLLDRDLNARHSGAVAAFIGAFGVDPNDRKTTWEGNDFRIPDLSTHEDWAGNLAHAVLYVASLVAVVALAVARRKGPDGATWRLALVWTACVLGGFLLFGWVLKWQLWHSRLHTPLFVLFAPVAALVLGAIPWRPVPAVVGLLLLVLSAPWALCNTSRPLVTAAVFTRNADVWRHPRDDQYFINRGDQTERYRKAARCIREAKCRQVGLLAGADDWEYPLWVFLGKDAPVRIEHLEVNNPSERAPGADAAYRPCALITIGRTPANSFGMTRKDACSTWDFGVWLP
ncbi:MAG: glycosyltransferase family 39 protein [Myxococcales bacterium]